MATKETKLAFEKATNSPWAIDLFSKTNETKKLWPNTTVSGLWWSLVDSSFWQKMTLELLNTKIMCLHHGNRQMLWTLFVPTFQRFCPTSNQTIWNLFLLSRSFIVKTMLNDTAVDDVASLQKWRTKVKWEGFNTWTWVTAFCWRAAQP